MTANLKPYPTYKPSGVEWLGDVPAHWRVKKIKHGYDIQLGKMLQPDKKSSKDIEKPYLRAANLSWKGALLEDVKSMWFSPEELEKFRLQKGDVLISEGGDVGRSCYWDSDLELYIQNAMTRARLKSKTCFSKYLYYWMYHLKNIGHIDSLCNAATIAHFTADKVKETLLIEPPIDEQHRIARFLNQKTAEIDEAINKKQRLIELLKEQKAILIYQAVTKGLNPNVPMRDSGMEWIGEVPAHWEIVRNGWLFVQRNEIGFPELPILEVSLKTGIRIRDFEDSDRKQVMSDRSMYKRAAKGDIAYNMMRMWQGAVGVAPVDGLVSPAYVVARPLTGTESRYFGTLFRTSAYMAEVDKYSRGIVKDRNRLYWEDFKQMPTPCPPPDEQVLIADAIDHNTTTIDEGIHRTERQISLFHEYRIILIADVVTGKLDVREDAHRES